jgi:hypothetical protein
MANVKLPYNASIDADQVGAVLERTLGNRYELRRANTPNTDWFVIASPVKAASVKLKQKPGSGETVIQVIGNQPSAGTRLALTILLALPKLYTDLVACKPIVNDVVQALESSPEFQPVTEPSPPTTSPPAS